MTTKPPELQVALIISSFSCTPEQLTDLLGVSPSDTWLTGDPIGVGSGKRKFSGWRLKAPVSHGAPLGEHVAWLIQSLPNNLNFTSVTSHWEVELAVVAHLYRTTPEMHLSSAQVAQVGRWNASVDVDLYILG